jgi:HEAT repeat protein
MRRLLFPGGRKWPVPLLVLVALSGLAWLNRTPLLAWYYLRQLAAAAPADREAWAGRAAGLDGAVLPGLLGQLTRDDPQVCANAPAGLAHLARRWGPADPRTAGLLGQLGRRFEGLSRPGREAALEVALALVRPAEGRAPPAALVEAGGRLLLAAVPVTDRGTRVRALALADVLAGSAPGRWLEACRALAGGGLAEDDGECRVRAIHLTLHSALRKDAELLRRVAPLLRDGRAEVRRAALLALGLADQVVADDDLLPLLHDADADARRLCEAALRGRGLPEAHLRLARLISAPGPEDRLRVLRHLEDTDDLDPGVWLRRLSQDPDAAVRFAAMAAASDNRLVDLSDRLREMRDRDPSPTVRQWAPYFLKRRGGQ